MIIVSQDKAEIVNFENVVTMRLGYNGKHIVRAENKDKVCELGEYATEERAKEVIGEIQVAYADFKYFEIMKKEETAKRIVERYGTFNIYKMPKE